MFSNNDNGVKVSYLPLRCGGVEVLQFENTQTSTSKQTELNRLQYWSDTSVNLHHWNSDRIKKKNWFETRNCGA